VSVLVALTVGLVFWIVAWALGVKAFDAFLVTVALVVTAVAARMVSPFLKQVLGRQTASPSEQGVERV
jgi:Mn2+/Fe2+ NRAMP family transporter